MLRILPLALTLLILSACDPTSTTDTGPVTAMQIADQINVVTPSTSTGKTSGAVASLLRAFSGADTDYTNDIANFSVHLEALGPVETANMILCYMGQLGISDPSTLNAGDYLALVDPSKCEKGQDSGGGTGESSSGVVVQRSRFVVNNSRVDNNSPQIVKLWLSSPGHNGGTEEIRGEMTITSSASDAPPFGLFTFNWRQIEDDPNDPRGRGSLVVFDKDPDTGLALVNGNVGLTLYNEERQTFENHKTSHGVSPYEVFGASARFVKAASAVMTTDSVGNVVNGLALTQMKVIDANTGLDFDIDARLAELNAQPEDFDTDQFSRTFAISYNSDNLLIQDAHLYAQLPYVLDPQDTGVGTCLSRHEFNEAIWCYDLYDSQSGARVAMNSGFPFTMQKDACGTKPLFGNLGYFGAWFEGDQRGIEGCSLASGDVITKQSFNGGAQEQYEVMRSTGHLVKNTVLQLPLTFLTGVDLFMNQLPTNSTMFRDPNLGEGEDPYLVLNTMQQSGNYNISNWLVRYLTTTNGVGEDGFYIVGYQSNGDHGPTMTLLSAVSGVQDLEAFYDVTPRSVDGQQIWFFSQQLGGSVRFTKGETFITYTKQEIVDPNDPLFANSDAGADLLCLFGCLKAGITDEDQSTPNGPMLSEDAYTVSGNLRYVPYQISRTDMGMKNMDDQDISLAEGATSSGVFGWGINMGPLVTQTQLNALTNWWEIWNTDGAVFYQWETGSNSWNTTVSARKVGTTEFASFDKPIQFSYTHLTANDRASDDTYNNQTFLLSYQGTCQLQGIPSVNVGGDHNSRYYPVFGISDGTTVGANGEYVVKALRGEQKPKEVTGECSAMNVGEPAVAIPSQVSGTPSNFDATMPEVSTVKVDNGVIID